MDNSLLRTVCFVPGEKLAHPVFSKFNPINTDTPIYKHFLHCMPPSESVFMGLTVTTMCNDLLCELITPLEKFSLDCSLLLVLL